MSEDNKKPAPNTNPSPFVDSTAIQTPSRRFDSPAMTFQGLPAALHGLAGALSGRDLATGGRANRVIGGLTGVNRVTSTPDFSLVSRVSEGVFVVKTRVLARKSRQLGRFFVNKTVKKSGRALRPGMARLMDWLTARQRPTGYGTPIFREGGAGEGGGCRGCQYLPISGPAPFLEYQ